MAASLRSLRVLAGLLVLAPLACGSPAAIRAVAPADLAELTARAEGPGILDVRSQEEFRRGHVPGALHVPYAQIAERLSELEPYRERGLVTYCESGRRAGMALQTLAAAGFRELGHLEGDMGRWRREGRPVETGPP